MKKILLPFIAVLLLASCAAKQVAVSQEYWQSPSKVGLLVQVNPPSKYKNGAQGFLDLAVTSGGKYKEALDLIEQEVHPKGDLVKMYDSIFSAKGKQLVVIDENFDVKEVGKFKGEKQKGKKYAQFDFAALKDKYQVDELYFVEVKYGFLISYYGMVELDKAAYAGLTSQLINLRDMSLISNNNDNSTLSLKKWKEENYEASVQGAKTTMDNVIHAEKGRL